MKKILVSANLILFSILALAMANPSEATTACTSHAMQKCISNISYWYDSCGVLEDLYKNCNTTGQVCKEGQCISNTPTTIKVNKPPMQTQVYQENGLGVSLFASKESAAAQWVKSVNVLDNDKVNFLLVVKNISSVAIDDVSIITDIGDGILSISDVKMNGAPLNEDITSGIDLNTVDPKNSNIISFTGLVMPQNSQTVAQITVRANSKEITYDSDYATLVIGTAAAPIQTGQSEINIALESSQEKPATTPFMVNLKKSWYIWVAILGLLVTLFIFIFRKLSSNI